MNWYMMIRRLYWPAILLLIGVLALLNRVGVIEHFWWYFWPVLLILIGCIQLAERAVLASEGYSLNPGTPYGYQGTSPLNAQAAAGQDAATSASQPESAIIAKRHPGFENDVEGGKQ